MAVNAADNMAELYERAQNSTPLNDLRQANVIELLTQVGGGVWVNIDGVCLIRIALCDTVVVDLTNALSTTRAARPEIEPEAETADDREAT